MRMRTLTARIHVPPSARRVIMNAIARATTSETPLNCTCVKGEVAVIVVNRTPNPSTIMTHFFTCDGTGSGRMHGPHMSTVPSGPPPAAKPSLEINGAESEDTKVESKRGGERRATKMMT